MGRGDGGADGKGVFEKLRMEGGKGDTDYEPH